MSEGAMETFDAAVIGGGPSGATAARELARRGHSVLLLDRDAGIKPCGGAVPPRLLKDFDVPESELVSKAGAARVISPGSQEVDMPIEGGFVGMVEREHFDEWLRQRAAGDGAERRTGTFRDLTRDDDGTPILHYRAGKKSSQNRNQTAVRARMVIGTDGARSRVAEKAMPNLDEVPSVFAYHEIVESPTTANAVFDPARCDVYYQGTVSPDFYGWVFPHGGTTSVGVGSAQKGFSLRGAVDHMRANAGLDTEATVRREGAPLPLRPRKTWDNGRDVILAGDAAGVVAPASGEGIYYAMTSGHLAAEAVQTALATNDGRALRMARKRFMKAHGQVFWILGIMQRYWYANDQRRERFVSICRDKDVQRLTWDAYMNKELVRADPLAHARIFFKNIAHLAGITPAAPRRTTVHAAE
jgi:geranylgeranyl reductase